MFIDGALLAHRIEHLRREGVTIRDDYPPSNIDSGPPHLAAVDAEITTAELLARRNDPRKLFVPKPPAVGDIDVLLQMGTKVGFQIKNLSLLAVDQAGRPNPLYQEALSARAMLLADVRRHPSLGTHTSVSLARRPDKVATMTGSTELRTFIEPIHHFEVRIPWDFYARLTKKKIGDAVKDSVQQLEDAGASIVVPVVALLGHAIDEIWAFDFVRDQLEEGKGFWGRADAVCLLTHEPRPTEIAGIFGQAPRFIPILNRHRQGFESSWVIEGTTVRLHDGAEISLSGFYAADGSPKLTTTEYRDGMTFVDGVPLARVVDDPSMRGMGFLGVPGPLRGPQPHFEISRRPPSRRR